MSVAHLLGSQMWQARGGVFGGSHGNELEMLENSAVGWSLTDFSGGEKEAGSPGNLSLFR